MFSQFKKLLFGDKPIAQNHIWKETKRENLGSYWDWGVDVYDSKTMYRIAIHEKCLITGEERIRQIVDLVPCEE